MDPSGDDSSDFLLAAEAIAKEVYRQARRTRDGSVVWLGEDGAPLGPHLYGGSMGIALFLAAFERVTGAGAFRETALAALAPVRRKLASLVKDREHADAVKIGIGGFVGLGSLLYSFLRIGRWLDEPALMDEAFDLVSLFTPARIAGDETLDIVAGSAGAVLALLALDREIHGGPAPVEAAGNCALRLIAKRSATGWPRGWPWAGSPVHPCLSGFAHGAAGICYALFKLFEKTDNADLLATAREGLAFERGLYDSAQQNWRDARFPGSQCMTTWCHGAAGIALGRLGSLGIDPDPRLREEANIALETTLRSEPAEVDHLCCGTMGRAEILLYASERLAEPRLLEAARALAREVLPRAPAGGRPADERAAAFDPTFFRGASGIGFTFLRLTRPELLPCVLILG